MSGNESGSETDGPRKVDAPEFHAEYMRKFDSFIRRRAVPNILVYGPSGSGKKHMVKRFLANVYGNNASALRSNVLYVDCINGKGINFIRDELKHFAKTNVNSSYFKSIILVLIDRLTIDAQSALRRCIELYNHNTRFFAIVENKSTIILPLLSRFCEMRLELPVIDGVRVNLHDHFRTRVDVLDENARLAHECIRTTCAAVWEEPAAHASRNMVEECVRCADALYHEGISCLDLMRYVEASASTGRSVGLDGGYHSNLLVTYFHKIRHNIRSEPLLMFTFLYTGFIRRSSIANYIAQ